MTDTYNNARLALSTGYYPMTTKRCLRCFSPMQDTGMMLCDNCREYDLLMPSVNIIRAEMESDKSEIVRMMDETELDAGEAYTKSINYPQ